MAADAAAWQALTQRLEALEVKSAYAEDLLDQLNLTLYRQQQSLDRLMAEVQALRQQWPQAEAQPRSLRDELPPHY